MRQALLVHDGVLPPSPLGDRILARFDARPEALVTWADDARPVDFGKFAPLVVELAEGGDELASALFAAVRL